MAPLPMEGGDDVGVGDGLVHGSTVGVGLGDGDASCWFRRVELREDRQEDVEHGGALDEGVGCGEADAVGVGDGDVDGDGDGDGLFCGDELGAGEAKTQL